MNTKIFTLGKIQKYKNMPDLITEALKDAILQGEYKGGVQLKQDEIAKQFDVSLIPVREALIQLEGKGLVNCIRNKGAIVTRLSLKEMHELFELRRVLEVGSAYLIKQQVEGEHLNKLKYILEKMNKPAHPLIYCRYYRLFYQVLCDTAANAELSKMYENLFVRVERYLMYIYHLVPELMNERSHQEKIVALLENEQYDALITHMTSHIEMLETSLFKALEARNLRDAFDWNCLLPFRTLEEMSEIEY